MALTAAAAGLVAWVVRALLERRTADPRRTWVIVATLALVVSLAGPSARPPAPAPRSR